MTAGREHPELIGMREAFQSAMQKKGAAEVWGNFSGRIAAVLSGGGARGAYEVGALLAFQDAELPTHIITASSVGSINAASFVAHSRGIVGKAEHLVDSWYDLTPPLVGIEWTRYLWVLIGLTAATAGLGNFIRYELAAHGLAVELADPALTWIALALAGVAVLVFYDRLSYLGYVLRNVIRKTSWKLDRAKLAWSVIGNAVVLGFVAIVCHSLRLMVPVSTIVRHHLLESEILAALALFLAAFMVTLRVRLRHHASAQTHRLLRLPLRSGLFANFERGRYLRQRIPIEPIRRSPIRVLFTATDLATGVARFFSNKRPEELAAEPGADRLFVEEEVAVTRDLIRAVLASSALPIIYEPCPVDKHFYFDGAIVSNQPIRPAIRLGADVLLIVMMDSPKAPKERARTFIDVGLRAVDFLMAENLKTDLKTLALVNGVCEKASKDFGIKPEQVEIDFGTRRYRYVRPYTIRPSKPLVGTSLDFDRATIWPAILCGYQDACIQIDALLEYARTGPPFSYPRRHLRLTPEQKPR